MIQFNSNTTDGLYCGSSNTCSAPATTRSPFSEVHLHPPHPPSRTCSARVRCFSFLPSPLHLTTVRVYETVICGWRLTLISFTGEGKRMAFPSRAKRTGSINWGWRWRVKAGIANSLSARCARACPFARTDVRMRKQWATWWAKKRAPFQKKRGGRREKKGRFVRKSTSFYLISFHSRKSKHFSHKTFDHSKLNSYFCAW